MPPPKKVPDEGGAEEPTPNTFDDDEDDGRNEDTDKDESLVLRTENRNGLLMLLFTPPEDDEEEEEGEAEEADAAEERKKAEGARGERETVHVEEEVEPDPEEEAEKEEDMGETDEGAQNTRAELLRSSGVALADAAPAPNEEEAGEGEKALNRERVGFRDPAADTGEDSNMLVLLVWVRWVEPLNCSCWRCFQGLSHSIITRPVVIEDANPT